MLYLSGSATGLRDDLASGRIGLLKGPANGNTLEGVEVWALDNGCYTGSYPGDEAYLKLLQRLAPYRNRCLFVAVPDVVGDGPATLAMFGPMARRIRAAGWPVALVLQDGMLPEQIPWADLAWVFVGGSTGWKLGDAAVALIREAQARGVGVHVGRVNSHRRYRHFAALGCDSADGTIVAFAPEPNAARVRRWITSPVQMRAL